VSGTGVTRLVQAIAVVARTPAYLQLAQDAMLELDALRTRCARLEGELAREKRAALHGMTDLA
jgi:hypothetical protein